MWRITKCLMLHCSTQHTPCLPLSGHNHHHKTLHLSTSCCQVRIWGNLSRRTPYDDRHMCLYLIVRIFDGVSDPTAPHVQSIPRHHSKRKADIATSTAFPWPILAFSTALRNGGGVHTTKVPLSHLSTKSTRLDAH